MSERDALAAKMFPAEWAQASSQTGKKAQNRRARLRRAAEYEAAMIPLRAAGRSCATCDEFSPAPHGMTGMICDFDSDFHGYTRAEASGLCPQWTPKG